MLKAQILIASDHAGFELKRGIQGGLLDIDWEDLGCYKKERVDYPEQAAALARRVMHAPKSLGILICGTGIGMAIVANKFPNVRAAVVENPSSARLSRLHNNANVLCLGARLVAQEYAFEIIENWLGTEFDLTEKRYQERLSMITQIEKQVFKANVNLS